MQQIQSDRGVSNKQLTFPSIASLPGKFTDRLVLLLQLELKVGLLDCDCCSCCGVAFEFAEFCTFAAKFTQPRSLFRLGGGVALFLSCIIRNLEPFYL